MPLSLITNRALTDANYYNQQFAQIVNDGWSSLSTAEQSAWLAANLLGGYWYTDLNRVGSAIQYLAGLLNSYGYAITVTARTNWTTADDLRDDAMAAYLADITAIKSKFYGTTALPAAMDYLGYQDANNIELLLLEVERYINNAIAAFWQSGEMHGGER